MKCHLSHFIFIELQYYLKKNALWISHVYVDLTSDLLWMLRVSITLFPLKNFSTVEGNRRSSVSSLQTRRVVRYIYSSITFYYCCYKATEIKGIHRRRHTLPIEIQAVEHIFASTLARLSRLPENEERAGVISRLENMPRMLLMHRLDFVQAVLFSLHAIRSPYFSTSRRSLPLLK